VLVVTFTDAEELPPTLEFLELDVFLLLFLFLFVVRSLLSALEPFLVEGEGVYSSSEPSVEEFIEGGL